MRIFDSIVRNRKVACILPNLAAALVAVTFAQTSPTTSTNKVPTAERVTSDGDRLVQKAATQLRQHASISAKIRHRLNLFGQELYGSGRYYQLPKDDRLLLRLELKIQLGTQMSSYRQISDGQFFWVRRHLATGSELSRIDLKRVRKQFSDQNQGTATILPLARNPGGLPALLTQLTEHFRFEDPRQAALYGIDVLAVRGHWQGPREEKTTGATGPTPRSSNQLIPDFLPRQVLLVLGQDDLFPYRLVYQSGSGQPLVVMEIFEVRIDEPLDPMLFAYHPPRESKVEDRTDEYLRQAAQKQRHTVGR